MFEYLVHEDYRVSILCFDNPIKNETYNNSKIEIIVLNNHIEKIKALKNLKGKILITTTPSIGTPMFPKSLVEPKQERPKYLYVFHSLVSPNEMYVDNSFTNFDYILAPSETISEQLKFLVSKSTKIFTTGYLLFDNLNPKQDKKELKNTALIAPTWGKSAVKKIINDLDQLLEFNNKHSLHSVFRPHPMTDIEKLNINSKIDVDLNKDLINLQDYKLLITDYSGIALEYFYLTKRPVIFLNVPKKIKRKLTKKEKNLVLIENEMREIIGINTDISGLKNLNELPILENSRVDKFLKKFNYSSHSLKNTLKILYENELI